MNLLLSCDTMVALKNSTKSGNVIFAKNSDRPLGEAQPLRSYEAQNYPPNTTLECTYISIPQVSHTYKVMGSQPFWMWGFEHGINEYGVVIGNEAVWSKEKEEHENGLLGMDLLRLGLERGKTAYEALHIITDLLQTYGQGGNAALHMEHRYHNAFLIADSKEAWILDTVNRRWAARKVTDIAGISNCYSTEEHWDEESGDIKEYAFSMGYADRDQPFSFAKAYGLVDIKTRSSYPRYKRLNQLLKARQGSITSDYMQQILKDHYEGELIEPHWSPADGIMASICMHNLDEISSKTAASVVIEIDHKLSPVWWGSMSSPCISVFLPYTMEHAIPKIAAYAGEVYEDQSLWWEMERLSYEIEIDYPRNIRLWNSIKNEFQEYVNKTAESGLNNAIIENLSKELKDKARNMYYELLRVNVSSSQPQRTKIAAASKIRANIKKPLN